MTILDDVVVVLWLENVAIEQQQLTHSVRIRQILEREQTCPGELVCSNDHNHLVVVQEAVVVVVF